jgi:hypothetical protein
MTTFCSFVSLFLDHLFLLLSFLIISSIKLMGYGVLKAEFSFDHRPGNNVVNFGIGRSFAFLSAPGIVFVFLSHSFSRVSFRSISDSSLFKEAVHLQRMILAH